MAACPKPGLSLGSEADGDALAPDADIDDPPEGEVNGPAPFQHVGCECPRTTRVEEIRESLERRLNALHDHRLEGAAKPGLLRRGEAELVAALAHHLRQ